MKNLVNFFPTTQKSEKITLAGSFCQKYTRFEPKTTEELSFMSLNIDANFE